MEWDEKRRKKNSTTDFAYMTALWIPKADAESLRMILDWNHWIFLFDDRVFPSWSLCFSHPTFRIHCKRHADNQIEFDEGDLKDDFPAAQAEIAAHVAIMNGTAPRYSADETEYLLKLRYAFQTCCDRLRLRAKPSESDIIPLFLSTPR